MDLWLFAISCLISDASIASDKNNPTLKGVSRKYLLLMDSPRLRGLLVPQCCHHTVMISLSLCTDPSSAHLHQASFSEAFPLGLSWLYSSRPHFFSPSNLGAGRGGRGRCQVTFPEVSAKVPFHLIGAIVLYAHCGQSIICSQWPENAMLWRKSGFWQKVGAVGRRRENEC